MHTSLVHDLPLAAAALRPDATALTYGGESLTYGELAAGIERFAAGLASFGIERGERVAIYLEKRLETVIAAFGAMAAGCAMVPLNPLLKARQVAHILNDCGARALVTSPERHAPLADTVAECAGLAHVVLTGADAGTGKAPLLHAWAEVCEGAAPVARVSDSDMAAILYTSGSTGQPKGVVLSHRNMVTGAKSVAAYLGNTRDDSLLAVLPLSFDAGFSQLTTGFYAGARVVLLNYLLPRDVMTAMEKERITGLTAVPPLYIQLSQLDWPAGAAGQLRYFANTGGHMPLETLTRLRASWPGAQPFLMYGLTEAFRATFLAPAEVDRRPDSIGKAIPNAEILVLREDGTPCGPGEPGELVQRGPLVAMGYWNDPQKTAERFRPLPAAFRPDEPPEIAVFSGDTVRADEEGFLYFVGRRDEMIKTSGYRVSPTEIEEVVYATRLAGEAAAFGVPDPNLGQAIVVVATPRAGATLDAAALVKACRENLPLYMVPAKIEIREGPLPRNPNGKIDRKALAAAFERTP